MLSTLDRIWFVGGGLVALFVALKPDRFIRIASYGRSRITDFAPALVKTLQVIAGFVAISTLIYFVVELW